MTAYTISKDFHFSASHSLDGLPPEHPCSRLHGHNFIVRVTLGSDHLDRTGFVLDYNDLGDFARWLDEQFDHQHLNDRVNFNPTSELMAEHIYRKATTTFGLPVVAIGWSETPKTWAVYQP